MQKKFFGDTSQTLYTLLYYIQQEDRLDYFKNNESGRMGSINSLFQIEDEKQKLVNIRQARKRVGELTDYLEKQIKEIKSSLCDDLENIPGAQAK